ncbi:ABC transporter substrate-binding protein [Paenibacillus sp. EPM92]|uniref:ABC transporter substrate-binding protein n=1 Tax=Paenibacillus sp. EPM92 TaxID=1561195 RepID=UPI001916B23B|nr:ABC transporter substrate-binding protein [Paenibacillus sp. EPM92]
MKCLNGFNKTITLSISLFLIMFALTGCGNAGAGPSGGDTAKSTAGKPEKADIKIGLPLRGATFLPIYLADQKGFFKEEGLNVSIAEFKGDAGVIQALAGNSVDINVASLTGIVNSIKSNQQFAAFWGGFNQAPFDWYSPNMKSMKDIKGKRFGVSTYGSLTDALTRYAVRQAGLDPEKDVQILQVGGSANALAAMQSGQIDASTLDNPYKFMAADKGWNLLLSERKDLTPTWPQHVVYANKDFIKKNPETIKAFLRAMVKGVDDMEKNPQEAAKVLADTLQFDEKYASKALEDMMPGFDKKGKIDPKGIEFFWKITVAMGDADKAWPDDQWLDNTFLNSADQWLK